MSIWIVGCGDIGRRVASLYQKDAVDTRGLVRTKESVALCERVGVVAQIYDLDTQQDLDITQFQGAKIFYFAPPPRTGIEDTRLHRFLKMIKNSPAKIVLISTTGVYGDSQGEWIDESFALAPVADRAKRRLSAETALKAWAKEYQKDSVILRVPGIYAKDRLPLQRLKKGLPVVKEAEAGWTNRIHADDLAQVCKVAMDRDVKSSIYNVTDGAPSTMTAYFNQVADAVGLPRPPQITMDEAVKTLSAGMVSYLKESRRISNQKMLKELGVILQYPDLKVGLKI